MISVTKRVVNTDTLAYTLDIQICNLKPWFKGEWHYVNINTNSETPFSFSLHPAINPHL